MTTRTILASATRSTLLALCCVASPLSFSQNSKLDAPLAMQLHSGKLAQRVAVIAQLTKKLESKELKDLRALSVTIVRDLPLIRAAALTVPRDNLSRLSALKFVRRLSWDGGVARSDMFTISSSLASSAWRTYLTGGYGVSVAVVDSGIAACNDLNGRVIEATTFASRTQPAGQDPCGHGTHVAGIIAGNGDRSMGRGFYQTFLGIAPLASVVNVPVLGPQGQGTVSQVIAGIQWVVENRSRIKPPIRVLNLSLGHPVGESYETDPLCLAVESAWKSGLTVVCAAGNGGRQSLQWQDSLDNEGFGTSYGSVNSPANSPYVITVGATKAVNGERAKDRIATYSSRGPSRLDFVLKPDLIAPGNRVVSLDSRGSYLETLYFPTNGVKLAEYKSTTDDDKDSRDYFRLSGTSMAAPVVAGAVALMLQKDPNLTPDTIKARLMLSADKWTSPSGQADPCTYGAGYLNVLSAMNSKIVANGFALSPKLVRDALGNLTFQQSTFVYGDKAIWGTGVEDLRCIWGSKAIWGTSGLVDNNRAIWGDSVWSDRAIWGSNVNNADMSSIVLNGE